MSTWAGDGRVLSASPSATQSPARKASSGRFTRRARSRRLTSSSASSSRCDARSSRVYPLTVSRRPLSPLQRENFQRRYEKKSVSEAAYVRAKSYVEEQ